MKIALEILSRIFSAVLLVSLGITLIIMSPVIIYQKIARLTKPAKLSKNSHNRPISYEY